MESNWLRPLAEARQERQGRLLQRLADCVETIQSKRAQRQIERLHADFVLAEIRLGLDGSEYPAQLLKDADPRLPDFHPMHSWWFYGVSLDEPLPISWAEDSQAVEEIQAAMECGNVAFVVGWLYGLRRWTRREKRLPYWWRRLLPGERQRLLKDSSDLEFEVYGVREALSSETGWSLPAWPLEPWAACVDGRLKLHYSGFMLALTLHEPVTGAQLRAAQLEMIRRHFVVGYCHAKGIWPPKKATKMEADRVDVLLEQWSYLGARRLARLGYGEFNREK